MEKIPLAEFQERLRAQGVPTRSEAAFVCPICKTVQSMASLIDAGAPPEEAENIIGFSCEGRLTGAGPWPKLPTKARKAKRGCDWSLGGLFRLHELEVLTDDGKAHPHFVVASPEQAQELAAKCAVQPEPAA